MKFIPLGNKPNISATRNGSANVSMQVDNRNFPHISWLENKNGHNEIHYSFWDGLQWAYHQNPMVGWAEEELVSSSNSLILGTQEKPFIAFCRRLPDNKSIITVASTQKNEWSLDELEVDYDTKWVGIFTYDYGIQFSSSSSSSSSSTSESSSSSIDSSSSSSIYSTFEDYYCMTNCKNADANGTYYRTGIYNYGRPVYFNGITYLYWHRWEIYFEWIIDYTIADFNDGVAYKGNPTLTPDGDDWYNSPFSIESFSLYNGECSGSFSSASSSTSSSSSIDSSSTSSSSSIDSSSSSSTSYSSSSSTSESSSSSSSSTSNFYSSSSSSIDSSSSSSTDDARMFITTYDSNSILRIYGIRPSGWHLLTEKQMIISQINTLKHVNCGKYLGITWNETNNIYYNFFDLNEEIWRYNSTQIMTVNGLSAIDVEGFNSEDDGKFLFAAVIENPSTTEIQNIVIDTNGVINYLGSGYVIESENVYVTGSNYVSSGYSKISVSLDPITGIFNIIALGGRLVKYSFNGSTWIKTYTSIEGISDGICPDKIIFKGYDGILNIAFSNMEGDVYFFVEDDNEETFSIVYPYVSVFNEQRLYIVQYRNGRLTGGVKIPCTWWERIGDILRESITRVNVVVTDGEDPVCYTSSSSSSESVISSSSTSSNSSSSSSPSQSSQSSGYYGSKEFTGIGFEYL